MAGKLRSKVGNQWVIVHKEMTKEGIKTSFQNNRVCTLAKDNYNATSYDNYLALAIAIRDRLVERWISTQQSYHHENRKRVYYLSLEFLIGRLLGNNIINLNLDKQTSEAMSDLGFDLEEIQDQEIDAGLGNGGLGRLAACFLDSMATLGIPVHGYGIRYEYGIFRQKIVDGRQVEKPDEWLTMENPWEFARHEYTVNVKFYGRTRSYHDRKGKLQIEWIDTEDILAVPYDIPVPGYGNDIVNTLRLWAARSTTDFDFDYFNDGDYEQAVYKKVFSENISKVLYPNDNVSQGRELRLKQEYFFTAAAIADIIRRYKVKNSDLRNLPDKVVIQLNDTHPTLAILELMRKLVDEEGLEWEQAWQVTTRCFAYTNHTIMPEALECWAIPLLEKTLPRHLQILYEINKRFLREIADRYPGNVEKLRRMSLIEEGNPKRARMAHLCIVGSSSVNGVSELHSELLKTKVFPEFHEFFPEKFNNKTNGITQRRWLLKANPRLSRLISETIGTKWTTDMSQMRHLAKFADDPTFQEKWREVKEKNKRDLARFIYNSTGITVDPRSLFDVQIKRIHEYKRQLLFALYIISEYLKLKKNSDYPIVPRTFLIAGKAAPGYFNAKLIIKFINNVAEVINRDKNVRNKLKLAFLENYGVSLAERIFPASELSEQISTAGKEASGTGCMKFMANGALTIGTLDGANIEIAREVGEDRMFIFGLQTEEIEKLSRAGYDPQQYINASAGLKEVIALVRNNFFSTNEPGIFEPLLHSLTHRDEFFVCADFDAYCQAQERVSQAYLDPREWTKTSILNVAGSGKFSSDRTIGEYAREIWKIPLK